MVNDKLLEVLGDDVTQDQAFAHASDVLSESKTAMNTIRRYAAEDAHLIFGAAYDATLGEQLRVTLIATGLSPARPQVAPRALACRGQGESAG